ncbi:hypothetical protein GWL_04930 [Herbaspirillum sp. GW103]|nr:hypothetical protein GWL_04930 [Herbaspirillum sp. GW103]
MNRVAPDGVAGEAVTPVCRERVAAASKKSQVAPLYPKPNGKTPLQAGFVVKLSYVLGGKLALTDPGARVATIGANGCDVNSGTDSGNPPGTLARPHIDLRGRNPLPRTGRPCRTQSLPVERAGIRCFPDAPALV